MRLHIASTPRLRASIITRARPSSHRRVHAIGLGQMPHGVAGGLADTSAPAPGFTTQRKARIIKPAEDWSKMHDQDRERQHAEIQDLVSLLPERVRGILAGHSQVDQLVEVVMDLGRKPVARMGDGDLVLSDDPITKDELEEAYSKVGTFGGDNRAGIDRTLHRISCIRNRVGDVVGLTCRVGRSIPGSAAMVADIVQAGRSVLLLGRPGSGKTTTLRDVARMLADVGGKRVVIVDTSNEIGGDGDIPHPAIGMARRMQVPDPAEQHRVMIEAVENHMPQVIIIDEIGTELEALAARTIAQRGVQLVATAHGNFLENLIKNPALSDLIGGVSAVTLSDDEARRRGVQKSVLERQAPPTFDAAVEMLQRDKWRVHLDIALAVDAVLTGEQPPVELREQLGGGEVRISSDDAALTQELLAGAGLDPGSHLDALATIPGLPAGVGDRGAAHGGAFGGDPYQQLDRALHGGGRGAMDAAPSLSEEGVIDENGILLYLMDVEGRDLSQAVGRMGMRGRVGVTTNLAQADAVLALRSRLKASGWLKRAAKSAGVPIYAVKSSSQSNLQKAVRILLGMDPSAGGQFQQARARAARAARASTDEGDAATAATEGSLDGWYSSADEELTASAGNGDAAVAAAADAAVAAAGGAAAGVPGAGRRSGEEIWAQITGKPKGFGRPPRAVVEALAEVTAAVEKLGAADPGQAASGIELLARSADVLRVQAALVHECGLSCERLGEGTDARLRVLPAASGGTPGGHASLN
ncbi:unnamed protein product [Pedinophyceae sp. YPF-701]|nr:unnamed protein product [Pedinophyceae sp. YPF-701]